MPKATSGGKFDPAERFLYFLAGSASQVYESGHPNALVACNEIKTGRDLETLDRMCDERNVLLDSGIFNLAAKHAKRHNVDLVSGFAMAPEEIDGFEELFDRYATIAAHHADRLWGVVELDQGGLANKPRIRARIEEEVGITPMPVYHPLLDGWDYYDTIAADYDRIAVGNLVKASPPIRLRLVYTVAERAKAYPHLWTHLLGLYPNENTLAMPLRGSCDSSSWLTSLRWMPSWKAWAMLKMITSYPPDMWAHQSSDSGTGEDYRDRYKKVEALSAATSLAAQHVLDTIDTHDWLGGPR